MQREREESAQLDDTRENKCKIPILQLTDRAEDDHREKDADIDRGVVNRKTGIAQMMVLAIQTSENGVDTWSEDGAADRHEQQTQHHNGNVSRCDQEAADRTKQHSPDHTGNR